ncbi:hypothetical protein PHJA_002178000 [Phtheirospermum japonicum]|uniref:Uncharacterized protein n=1 Tax=Phtheirospermum japonicum TaxID=374723 RepID=A0A830CMX6_9LAMI|nr:hypothetical protein PHJA_002178000 [Phtheirospermum japonicum]
MLKPQRTKFEPSGAEFWQNAVVLHRQAKVKIQYVVARGLDLTISESFHNCILDHIPKLFMITIQIWQQQSSERLANGFARLFVEQELHQTPSDDVLDRGPSPRLSHQRCRTLFVVFDNYPFRTI